MPQGLTIGQFNNLFNSLNEEGQKKLFNITQMDSDPSIRSKNDKSGRSRIRNLFKFEDLRGVGLDLAATTPFMPTNRSQPSTVRLFVDPRKLARIQNKFGLGGKGGGRGRGRGRGRGGKGGSGGKDFAPFTLNLGPQLGTATATKRGTNVSGLGDLFNQQTAGLNRNILDIINSFNLTPAGQLANRQRFEDAFFNRLNRRTQETFNRGVTALLERANQFGRIASAGTKADLNNLALRELLRQEAENRQDAILAAEQLADADERQRLMALQALQGARGEQQAFAFRPADFALSAFGQNNQLRLARRGQNIDRSLFIRNMRNDNMLRNKALNQQMEIARMQAEAANKGGFSFGLGPLSFGVS